MFFNFNRAFILFSFLKIILNQNINVINTTGLPVLTFEIFLNFCFLLFFIINHKKISTDKTIFPLKKTYYLVLSSIFIASIFSISSFSQDIARGLGTILNDYLFAYILWRILYREKDIRLLLYGLAIMCIFLIVYGYYEKISDMNPIYDYELALNSNSDKVTDWQYSVQRLGMGRITSAIIHPIGLGIILSSSLVLFWYINENYKKFSIMPYWLLIIYTFTSLNIIFFTNSRTPILFLFLCSAMYFIKKRINYKFVVAIILVIIIGGSVFHPYLENIYSIFTITGTYNEVGGSDLTLRKMQLAAAWNIAKSHLLTGLGMKSIDLFYGGATGILGGESVWIGLAIQTGLLGIVAYVFLMISVFMSGKGASKKFVHFFSIAWIISATASSLPGVGFSFFLMCIIIVNKIEFAYMKQEKYLVN